MSGAALFIMIGVICADVLLRLPGINKPFVGAYDIVRIAGAITLAGALPYTTAVKGHVAIEYFFHKLGRTSRIVVDSAMRLLSIILFAFLGWRSVGYGQDLYRNNQVSQTLQIPLFWLPWVIGLCCFVSLLVIAYQLACPKQEMIKP
jgi:TRAP-type C4-dicarboxylate transport system permease small subunit